MKPFFRVDNRLVHGQIMATWTPHLRLNHFLVASDTVPENSLQMSMFRMAIPNEIRLDAMPLREAAQWLAQRGYGQDRTIVLLETVEDACRLFEEHPFAMLNIGNVHHAPGRRPVTSAVYLGDEDLARLDGLLSRGVQVEVRSLPTETALDLRQHR